MTKPHVLLIGPFPEWDLEPLEAHYQAHRYWELEDRDHLSSELTQRVRAIATRAELGANADLMSQFPKLEMVACYGTGTDAIDLEYAAARGIRVSNTPDVVTEDTADMGIALLLAVARRIVEADTFVRSGHWGRGSMALTTRFFDKRVGIFGLGRIGAAVARRLEGFGCDIGYYSRHRKSECNYRFHGDPVELAAESDFLIVTLAGGEETRGMVSSEILEALGPAGILVNVSRGTTIDEEALLSALEKGHVRGAGLDVFLGEPALDKRFLTLDNVVLQPHQGSGTVETRREMGRLMRDNLAAYFSGAPLPTPVV